MQSLLHRVIPLPTFQIFCHFLLHAFETQGSHCHFVFMLPLSVKDAACHMAINLFVICGNIPVWEV